GDWQLDHFSIAVSNVPLGGFKLQNLSLSFDVTGDTTIISGTGFLLFPRGWGVGGSLTFVNGELDAISVVLEVERGEGLPVADTGLFLVQMQASVENLLEPSNLVVSGSLSFDYGGQLTLGNKQVSAFRVQGGFTCDKNGLTLEGGVYFG